MNKQLNYNSFILLNKYDLLNKFNFKSIYELPRYKTAEFKVFLKDSGSSKITQLQIESVFFFYILGLNNICLTLKYSNSLLKRSCSILTESIIKSKVLKQELLDSLFSFYLIIMKSSYSFFLSEDIVRFSRKSGKPLHKKFYIISYLPANLLVEKREQHLTFFNDLKIFICFEVSQPTLYLKKKKNYRNLKFDRLYFKNIFPFWAFN